MSENRFVSERQGLAERLVSTRAGESAKLQI